VSEGCYVDACALAQKLAITRAAAMIVQIGLRAATNSVKVALIRASTNELTMMRLRS